MNKTSVGVDAISKVGALLQHYSAIAFTLSSSFGINSLDDSLSPYTEKEECATGMYALIWLHINFMHRYGTRTFSINLSMWVEEPGGVEARQHHVHIPLTIVRSYPRIVFPSPSPLRT